MAHDDERGTASLTLFDRDDYLDVGELMERYREEFGEEISERRAWELLTEQSREDLEWVVEDADALLSRENPGGALAVRGTQQRWDGPSSGFCDPYGSFASLMGDTGRGGVFQDCGGFRVYVDGGSLFVDGFHHDGRVSVEVRAMSEEQLERFDGAADAALRGRPGPMIELWERASRLTVLQGGLALAPPGGRPAAQGPSGGRLAAAAGAAEAAPARARRL